MFHFTAAIFISSVSEEKKNPEKLRWKDKDRQNKPKEKEKWERDKNVRTHTHTNQLLMAGAHNWLKSENRVYTVNIPEQTMARWGRAVLRRCL